MEFKNLLSLQVFKRSVFENVWNSKKMKKKFFKCAPIFTGNLTFALFKD